MALRPFFIIGFNAQPETTLPERKGKNIDGYIPVFSGGYHVRFRD
jgi:hypothetical protein